MWTTGTANLRFIDTAGLRKRGKVEDGVKKRYSVLRSLAAVERAKVCVIMIDGGGLYRAGQQGGRPGP